MGGESVLPSRPSSAPRKPSAESDFWGGLFIDLGVRVEWLGQAIAAVPKEDVSAATLSRLESYAQALAELLSALDRVQTHRSNPKLKPLFSLDGPLAAFLSRLFGWSDEIGDDFERMAAAVRRREPTSVVFSHRAVDKSYAHFEQLIGAMRSAIELAQERNAVDEPVWRAFNEHVEELIWATEWLHLALARSPGE